MKKIIIDSSILFAALRGKHSKTRNKLLESDLQFYTPNFLIGEIFKHKERILHHSKASDEETYEFLLKIL
ncbi:MAG: type II toxin-antitoxin system VapC family toxin, partial [Bacteroidota bacterium]